MIIRHGIFTLALLSATVVIAQSPPPRPIDGTVVNWTATPPNLPTRIHGGDYSYIRFGDGSVFADVIGTQYGGGGLIGSVVISTVSFAHSTLRNANFNGATLVNANMSYANISGGNFGNAHMDGIDLSYANLSGASMINARMAGAELANLTGANLINVNLTGGSATLYGDLTSADFRGASLGGGAYFDTLIDYCTYKNTIWTDGNVREFEMDTTDDFLHVYEGASIAAVIGGEIATISVDNVTVGDGAILSIEDSQLTLDMMAIGDGGVFHIGDFSSVEFDANSELIFDFGSTVLTAEDKVLFIDGELSSFYIGYEGVTVTLVGSNLNDFQNVLFVEDGNLYIGNSAAVVPEPSTALLALAGVGLLVRRRRSR